MNYVLIVDDEPLIRASISNKVEEFRSAVTVSGTACNGLDALEWLDVNYADICITDVRMPLMDGLQLINTINERYPWIACLIISSYDDFNYARQGIRLGVMDYILKPIDQSLLNEALDKTCKNIYSNRLNQAHDIFIRKGSYNRKLQEKWVELLKSGRNEAVKELVGETLEMIKTYAENKSFLLESFSIAWLQLIEDELRKENVLLKWKDEYELKTEKKTMLISEIAAYHEDRVRHRLQAGINDMLESNKGVVGKKSRRNVEQIKEYIRENYRNQITLQELADQVEMSRTYISNLFKSETGMTIWNYLLSVRMEKAAELLKITSLKVYEVAYQVGYDSNVHFTQVFKEYYGVSPSEYKS